jgi:hypothetical protein
LHGHTDTLPKIEENKTLLKQKRKAFGNHLLNLRFKVLMGMKMTKTLLLKTVILYKVMSKYYSTMDAYYVIPHDV